MIIHNPILTGSFTVNGTDVSSITSSAANITSLNATTASLNAFSASVLTFTGSINSFTASINTFTASAATTGSNTFKANQVISGSLTISGSITATSTLTAQTLVVQTVTSSVVYSSGSNVFGNSLANTQTFTGSINMTGSLNIIGNSIFTGSISTTGTGYFGNDVFTYNNGGIFFSGGGTYTSGIFQNANGLNLQTGTTPRLTISSSGAIGIGTTSTITLFDTRLTATDSVNGTAANSYPIASFIVNASGGGQRGLQIGGPTGGIVSPVFLKVYGTSQRFSILDSSNVENFTISGGNVGIGTTNPVGPLVIAAPATGSSIAATTSQQAYDYSRFRIKHYSDSNVGLSIGYAGANYTYIQTCYNEGTTSPLFINPFGGNVSIGTNTSTNRVDIWGGGSNTSGLLGVRSSGGGTFIMGRMVSAETSNQTQTIATCSAPGTNERIFLKIQVLNVSAVNDYGNCHVGYAVWSKSGTKSTTTMTLDTGNSGVTNSAVGSLSWSGDNLQYTTNRAGNYEMNHITIWASARDTGIVS